MPRKVRRCFSVQEWTWARQYRGTEANSSHKYWLCYRNTTKAKPWALSVGCQNVERCFPKKCLQRCQEDWRQGGVIQSLHSRGLGDSVKRSLFLSYFEQRSWLKRIDDASKFFVFFSLTHKSIRSCRALWEGFHYQVAHHCTLKMAKTSPLSATENLHNLLSKVAKRVSHIVVLWVGETPYFKRSSAVSAIGSPMTPL